MEIAKKKSQKEIKEICRHIPGNKLSEEDKEREALASTWAVLALKMGEGDIDYLRHDMWMWRRERRYIRRVWNRCEILPLSKEELDALNISSQPSPEEKMAAWWTFTASTILNDVYIASAILSFSYFRSEWDSRLPKKLKKYLCFQADRAATQFWGTHATSIDQFKLLNQVWRCIGIYAKKTSFF